MVSYVPVLKGKKSYQKITYKENILLTVLNRKNCRALWPVQFFYRGFANIIAQCRCLNTFIKSTKIKSTLLFL